MAHFFARSRRAKKPGFPLQVLGFAYANPVGFPLQSLARAQRRPANLQSNFAGAYLPLAIMCVQPCTARYALCTSLSPTGSPPPRLQTAVTLAALDPGGLILFTRSRLKDTKTGSMAKKKVMTKAPLLFNALNYNINDTNSAYIQLYEICF
jgi:hypothetical protein